MSLGQAERGEIVAAVAEGLSRGVSFVPGLQVPVGELLTVTLTSAIVVATSTVGTDSAVLSDQVGFLWQQVAIDSTGEFTWVIKPSGFDFFNFSSGQVHSNTFKGEGTNTNNMAPITLPVAWYFPGGTTIDLNVTDLSTNDNTIDVTLIGQRIRPGSQMEIDLLAAMAYAGMGAG